METQTTRSFQTHSAQETQDFGCALAEALTTGQILCLFGDLGTGKTCLVQGIARGLQVRERWICSPTFSILNEYEGRLPLYHMDLYRLGPIKNIRDLGMEETFEGQGVVVVEWANRMMQDQLPMERIDIVLHWTASTERRLSLSAHGTRAVETLDELTRRWHTRLATPEKLDAL